MIIRISVYKMHADLSGVNKFVVQRYESLSKSELIPCEIVCSGTFDECFDHYENLN